MRRELKKISPETTMKSRLTTNHMDRPHSLARRMQVTEVGFICAAVNKWSGPLFLFSSFLFFFSSFLSFIASLLLSFWPLFPAERCVRFFSAAEKLSDVGTGQVFPDLFRGPGSFLCTCIDTGKHPRKGQARSTGALQTVVANEPERLMGLWRVKGLTQHVDENQTTGIRTEIWRISTYRIGRTVWCVTGTALPLTTHKIF
ncbi:uncharacterized protein LALA0_S08e04610g [Lachancea lanzarotensis]|uniref:LALA0S08e04610g1_1 n=1 Tax=Lachancea lanzarotensis TaxID=1245769 RepID=A0A0C7N6N6_9SACH|nr:uncharacterized protein LALA0_S08e04610g [Lachancea lanzarotensis]CEP63531.1 LALA0S08e04610g1_1 [Lachancea lanzarotensis]